MYNNALCFNVQHLKELGYAIRSSGPLKASGLWKRWCRSGSFSYPGPRPSGAELPFIWQERNRTQKVRIQWNNKTSHCLLGRGGFMDDGWRGDEQGDTNNWCHWCGYNKSTAMGRRMTKNHYREQESIPCHLLSRQVYLLAFEASGIEPVSLALKASNTSIAPLVLHYTSCGSGIRMGSWMRMNTLYLIKHSMFSDLKKTSHST